jgi:hypothetical protein
MAKRPEGVDKEQWLAERQRVWKRRNMVINGLMLIVIVAIYVRNCT